MATSPHTRALALTALGTATAAALGAWGWPQADRTLEFTLLVCSAMLLSTFTPQLSLAAARAMRPAFVVEFATLMLLGVPAALAVAGASELVHLPASPARWRPIVRWVVSSAAALVAVEGAGAVHRLAGGTVGAFVWPWQALPVAAAVLAYSLVRSSAIAVVVPFAIRHDVDPQWSARVLRSVSAYAVGGGIAAGLAEMLVRGQWTLLPAAAVPVYFAWDAYRRALDRSDEAQSRREVIDQFVQGLAVVDAQGQLTLWSDELERLLACTRVRARGRSLVTALPTLGQTDLPRVLEEVLRTRTARTLPRVVVALPGGSRAFLVRVVPVESGAALLWQDLSRDDAASRRADARLALAAEAANDGLWEWDLRSQECFFSGRWRAVVGLPAQAGAGRPEDWFHRVHPDDATGLREAIEAHMTGQTAALEHEHRVRHQDGGYRWVLCRGVVARAPGGAPVRLAGSLTPRSEHGLLQERAGSAGFLDPLTGLANRSVFVERLGRRLAELKERPGGDRFAVLYLDLDRFKVVNDSLGHLVGDELLSAVSRRLEACLRPDDLLARLGGDEFAVLLASLRDEAQANAIAFRIQESLSAPFSIGGREVFTTVSIGIAMSLVHYSTPDEMMRDADTAMYHAKTRGKARHELFDADMHARVRDRLGLESDLRHAVNHQQFEVHYQPIVLLASGMCVGFESLIRWKRHGEPVSPDTFIPLAEELGLIEPLGTFVLREACRTFAAWQRQYACGLDYITVNVSSRQLMQHNFLGVVEKAVHDAGLQPSDLRLEITETALMENPQVAAAMLRELRDFGVKIYLDDFGTGYSSLSHLHKLPVDALKIDRSFVKSLERSDRPIVESILALARTLNTSVVAEGIETDAQAQELERLGCTHAQGYLFSRPLSREAAEEMLLRNAPLGPKRTVEEPRDIATGEDVFGSSSPFTWPETVPIRPPSGEGRAPALTHAPTN